MVEDASPGNTGGGIAMVFGTGTGGLGPADTGMGGAGTAGMGSGGTGLSVTDSASAADAASNSGLVAPLTVREVGGSDVANVDTLEFDADDFAVTGEGSGVVRVALTNAADPYHYEVMMADFGSGLEPMTDAAGDWLYGRYEGSLY